MTPELPACYLEAYAKGYHVLTRTVGPRHILLPRALLPRSLLRRHILRLIIQAKSVACVGRIRFRGWQGMGRS